MFLRVMYLDHTSKCDSSLLRASSVC